MVRSVGLAENMDDLRRIVVKTDDGRPIYLDDVADLQIGGAGATRGADPQGGKGEVVAGMVVKLYGTNASTVIARVEQKIDEINGILPDGLQLTPYYQQKEIVEASVATVTQALVTGIVLVALVLLVFMGGFRPAVVVALAIPFSVLFAFIAMYWLDLSANLMSLGGLAIAIGMMVDGTIVVVENIDRPRPPEGSRQATRGRDHVAVGLQGSRPAHRLRHRHHHHRLPPAVHAPGRRGQDLPPAGVHRRPGHARIADLRAAAGPDAGGAGNAGERHEGTEARRHGG